MALRPRFAASLCGAAVLALLGPACPAQADDDYSKGGLTIEKVHAGVVYGSDPTLHISGACPNDGDTVGGNVLFERPNGPVEWDNTFRVGFVTECRGGRYEASGLKFDYRPQDQRLRPGETVRYRAQSRTLRSVARAQKSGTTTVGGFTTLDNVTLK